MSDSAHQRDEGLRRQLEALGDRPVAGWKVGLTSGAARDSMGAGFRPFGYILAERVFESEARIEFDQFSRVGVENELCFRMASPLGGDASREQALAAVASVAAAFEINEQRLARDAEVADRLADDLNQWGIVVGQERRLDWPKVDFNAVAVTLHCDARPVESVAARGHIDDHFTSIAALARQLSRFGRTLEAGSRVITGSYTRQSVTAPGRWMGDFGSPIGRVAVEFA
jgi:2-keto-4-pentenoate hydratase